MYDLPFVIYIVHNVNLLLEYNRTDIISFCVNSYSQFQILQIYVSCILDDLSRE